jgi:hypothetical protein
MARKKPAKSPRKARADGGPVEGDIEVIVEAEGMDAMPAFNPISGTIEVPLPDGSLEIDLSPVLDTDPIETKHDDNLAQYLDIGTLGRISNQLIEGIEQDDHDRGEWLQQRSDGMDLLAVKVERPGATGVGTSATGVPGQATVRDPIMLEAVTRFQANAYGELCPSEGPCKAVNYGDETTENDALADEFEKDFNFYLTTTAKEYYPDTRKMLFMTGYASGMFKKVYKCPLRRRPVSESVDGADLIIPSNITDLHNAGRITHQISMRQSVMRRMQLLGVYRNVALTAPVADPNVVEQKIADITGMVPSQNLPEDQDYTVYECYCELDIPGFEHKEDGESEPSGLPLPYRVTLEKESRQILEIRRNWNEGDPDLKAKIPFVAFPYITGIGVYGLGLLHYLGNITMALTAMLRLGIDNGMFANFPGFLFAKEDGRQLTNEFRVPPGGGAPIDTQGQDIRTKVMALPYKETGPAFIALMAQVREVGMRLGGTAETPIGEGKQDAPVGTTLAMIEQATKVEGGVHKALHQAQAEELQLLKELFRDDPEALWRGNKRPAMGANQTARLAKFKAALENCEIVPASDPNVPSETHRKLKASALKQLTAGNAAYNQVAVDKRVATMLKIDDFDSLLAPPQQMQPDPAVVAALQLEAQKVKVSEAKVQVDAFKAKAAVDQAQAELASREQIEAMKLVHQNQPQQGPDPAVAAAADMVKLSDQTIKNKQLDLQAAKLVTDAREKQLDRDSKEAIEAFKLVQAQVIHPEAAQLADQELGQMESFLEPARSAANGGRITREDPDDPANDLIDGLATARMVAESIRARRPYYSLPNYSLS